MDATGSGASTPNSRFTSQGATAEDLLKFQTVGLVQLDEFRKRRRDVEEMKLKDMRGAESDGVLTPKSDGSRAGTPGAGAAVATNSDFKKKKKRKIGGKGLLSFGADEGDDDDRDGAYSGTSTPQDRTGKASRSPLPENLSQTVSAQNDSLATTKTGPVKRKLMPNPNAKIPAPKIMTKAAMAADAEERERLRKEFLEVQRLVRSTDVAVPFVFYDGSNIPGGTVRVKKGDHIWLFLERCRKVGAEMVVQGDRRDNGSGVARPKIEGKKFWARIGIEDLLCVRGGIIIPHHYELYYFIANKIEDPATPGQLLFNYSGTAVPKPAEEEGSLLRRPKDERIEGEDDDPTYMKVVDRRWYERNKHIYPASLWKEYKAGKEFEELAKSRKDAQGNSFFFS